MMMWASDTRTHANRKTGAYGYPKSNTRRTVTSGTNLPARRRRRRPASCGWPRTSGHALGGSSVRLRAHATRQIRANACSPDHALPLSHHGGVTAETCPFCNIAESEVISQIGACVAIWTHELPRGSLMVIPIAHRQAPWDLTADEWKATQVLLQEMMQRVHASHRPDGWNVGWNVGTVGGQSVDHAHCHLIPRYKGERYAGKGVRWLFKQPENAVDVPSS
jgi:histidine triad (HIT) family protein